MSAPTCPGLRFVRLASPHVDAFHALCLDEHVRAYLLDGLVLPRAWADEELARSDQLFAAEGVGLWLAEEGEQTIGFCGFRVFETLSPAPQLLYALRADATGRGLATRMCGALRDHATTLGWPRIEAAVDVPNHASVRVLQKCGFVPCGRVPGEFGEIILVEWPSTQRIASPVGTVHRLTIDKTWNGAPIPADERIEVAVTVRESELVLEVEAPFFDDPRPSSSDTLWNHEVFELMLLGAGDRYLEIELSPHGHHLVLMLDGYRNVHHRGMPMLYEATREPTRWRGTARIPMAWIPERCTRLNAFAMHGEGDERRHLAWKAHDARPGERPDFHRLAVFGSFGDP